MVFCPAIFSVVICSRMILHFWLGDGFGPAIVVMMILAAGALLSSYAYFCSFVLNAYGVIKIPNTVGIITFLANIGLGVFFAFFFKMGLPGLAIGALLVALAESFFFIPIFTCHILKTDVKRYYLEFFCSYVFDAYLFWVGAYFSGGSSFFIKIFGFVCPWINFLCLAYFSFCLY